MISSLARDTVTHSTVCAVLAVMIMSGKSGRSVSLVYSALTNAVDCTMPSWCYDGSSRSAMLQCCVAAVAINCAPTLPGSMVDLPSKSTLQGSLLALTVRMTEAAAPSHAFSGVLADTPGKSFQCHALAALNSAHPFSIHLGSTISLRVLSCSMGPITSKLNNSCWSSSTSLHQ